MSTAEIASLAGTETPVNPESTQSSDREIIASFLTRLVEDQIVRPVIRPSDTPTLLGVLYPHSDPTDDKRLYFMSLNGSLVATVDNCGYQGDSALAPFEVTTPTIEESLRNLAGTAAVRLSTSTHFNPDNKTRFEVEAANVLKAHSVRAKVSAQNIAHIFSQP